VEGSESLKSLLSAIYRLHELIGGANESNPKGGSMLAFEQWVKVILHYLKSSSLPLRLVGCEHMESIVQ
jgi:hypothetical protein